MEIPESHQAIMPYLVVPEPLLFLDFMRVVFGAREQCLVTEGEVIVHGELRIGDALILFKEASSNNEVWGSSMLVYMEDMQDCYKVALSLGSKDIMEPTLMDYGFAASFVDPFGNRWIVVQG